MSEESPGGQSPIPDGGRRRHCQPCVQDTRLQEPRSHGIEINRHTVEFSSNRRPNHSYQNLRSDRRRPGVAQVFQLFCASELISPAALSQFLAIRFRLRFLSPSAFSILADRSRVLRLPPGLRHRFGLSLRCGAPNCIGTCFPLPNRPFAGRSDIETQFRHRENTMRSTPWKATTSVRVDSRQKITPGYRPLARRVPKGQRRENLVRRPGDVKLPDHERPKNGSVLVVRRPIRHQFE